MGAKEMFRKGLRIEAVGGNCLVSVATCALKELMGREWDAEVLNEVLFETNGACLKVATRLMRRETGLIYENHLVGGARAARRSLCENLDRDGLCKLTVKWADFAQGTLKEEGEIDDDWHAILVFGYYAPKGDSGPLWLYLADPYSERLWFVPFETIWLMVDSCLGLSLVGVFRRDDQGKTDYSWWERLFLTDEELETLRRVSERKAQLLRVGTDHG